MRRSLKILAWTGGTLLMLPVVAVGAVFTGLNTDPGRRLAERLINQVTGGTVFVSGLSGRFPDHLRLARLEVRDKAGTWLSADGIVLDWQPTALLHRQALIDQLAITHGSMARLPQSDPAAPAASDTNGKPFTLPVRVTARVLKLERFDLAQPVAGKAAALALEGSADVSSLQSGEADLRLRQLDGEGRYALRGRIAPAGAGLETHATLDASEPAHGLVAGLANLPDLGALRVQAGIDGPTAALTTRATIEAGPLRANAAGTVNLDGQAIDLTLGASAPAMQPRPDLSWQSVSLDAKVRGPWTKPDATGQLRIEGVQAAGASLGRLTADLSGNAGQVQLRAAAEALRLPGPAPDLLAAAPLQLTADARLDDPARPVAFTLSHPVLSLDGRAQTAGNIVADATLTVPQLAPLTAIGGLDLRGNTRLALHAALNGQGAGQGTSQTTNIDVDGTVGITGGLAPVPGLVGPDAKIGVSVQLAGNDVRIQRAEVNGRTLKLSAQGSYTGGQPGAVDLAYTLGLSDLAVLAPTVSGTVEAQGTVKGKLDALAVSTELKGDVGAEGVPRGPVSVSLQAQGLPGAPTGAVVAQGTLAGAPLNLRARAQREADGTLHATIERAEWRSAHAEGDLRLPPGATLPLGQVSLRMGRLDDLRPFIGQPVSGQVDAQAELTTGEVRLHLDARDAGIPGSRVGRAQLQARVSDPLHHPAVTAQLDAEGIAAGGITGSARVGVTGPQEALAIQASAALRNLAGADAQVTTNAVLDVPGKQVRVSALQAAWKGETARLLAPVRVAFGNGVVLDQLRLGVRQAVLEASGRVLPQLDLSASLRNVTADLLHSVAPDLQADGSLSADAKLRGPPARPDGTVRVQANGLRLRTGPARALPPANLTATAQLAGGAARLDARLAAGSTTQLTVAGRVPLDPAGAVDLRATGGINLQVLDPILAADGRRVRGQLALDLGLAGTIAAPRVTGTARLQGAEIQDYGQGVRLDDVNGTLAADGQVLRITSLTARAGGGTIGVTGSVGVLAPDLPVDLAIQLRNARPLSSDRLTATVSGDLAVRGPATGRLAASGTLRIQRAEINIPERLPTSVAVLDVRRPGERRAPPQGASTAASGPDVSLDLTVQAPSNIFVRGRGLDSELGGELRVRGAATAPQVSGGFEMRRGTISVAGTTLNFTRGKVGFDGTGPTGKIDPSLDFVAESSTSSVTARLLVGGYASAPKITLSATPDLPQDEVLAYLLFKRSSKELGPFQLASIAAALAQLTGVGGGIGNPLDSVRKGLGLDRLSVDGGSSGNSSNTRANSGPTLAAGRYVANGVYVGAKQGTSGSQTQAEVQIDITKGLKLQTDVGTGQGGNSVGLTYQFEW